MGIALLHPSYVSTRTGPRHWCRGPPLAEDVPHLIIARQHFQQLDLEDQIGVRLDMRAEFTLAVA